MTSALGKDLLGLENLSSEQIRLILDTAEPFKEISERSIKKVPALRGSTIVLKRDCPPTPSTFLLPARAYRKEKHWSTPPAI